MTKSPKVFIIILTWDGKEDALECLKTVKELNYDNFEVVVVDNASSDDTVVEIKNRFPDVTVIRNKDNLGYAGGNNVGIEYCKRRDADYIFLLNNDLVIERNCLKEMIKISEQYPKGGIFGPKTYKYYEPQVVDFVGGKFDWRSGRTKNIGEGEKDVGQYEKVEEFDFMNGHAFLIRRKVVDEVGMLDEEYFGYYEETDWCIRAGRKGYKCVYVPKAIVWHKVSRAPYGLTRPYLISRNQILFMRKNAARGQFIVFLLNYFIFQFPHRILSFIKRRNWAELNVLIKAVGWNFGLWKENNPLSIMLKDGESKSGK